MLSVYPSSPPPDGDLLRTSNAGIATPILARQRGYRAEKSHLALNAGFQIGENRQEFITLRTTVSLGSMSQLFQLCRKSSW
jgi:hypothetical protein